MHSGALSKKLCDVVLWNGNVMRMKNLRKGIGSLIVMIAILIIGLIAVTAGTKVTTGTIDVNMQEITEKTAVNIYNELLLISATEQGVKYYDTKKNFMVQLNQTHLRLTYKGKTGTIADTTGKIYTYAIRHNLQNIQDIEIKTPTIDRYCISKRIENCVPVITICFEGETCCSITPNYCKTVK